MAFKIDKPQGDDVMPGFLGKGMPSKGGWNSVHQMTPDEKRKLAYERQVWEAEHKGPDTSGQGVAPLGIFEPTASYAMGKALRSGTSNAAAEALRVAGSARAIMAMDDARRTQYPELAGPGNAVKQWAIPPEQPQDTGPYNPFDAPVPGQSLTETPGNAKWEHPPQFVRPDKALDMIYDNLTKPKTVKQLIMMYKNDVPVEAIARTVLFAGFQEGKWTPDLAMLIAKPVAAMLAAIGKRAGIDNLKIKIKRSEEEENPIIPFVKQAVVNELREGTKKATERKEQIVNSFLKRGSI